MFKFIMMSNILKIIEKLEYKYYFYVVKIAI